MSGTDVELIAAQAREIHDLKVELAELRKRFEVVVDEVDRLRRRNSALEGAKD